jgi:hypothetical protein
MQDAAHRQVFLDRAVHESAALMVLDDKGGAESRRVAERGGRPSCGR